MPKKKEKRRPPRSGDAFLDTLFFIMIDALEKHVRAIYAKKQLRDPDTNAALSGLLMCEDDEIYLKKQSRKDRNQMVSALVHEVLHFIMPRTFEEKIERMERILMTRLTDEQKKYLRGFLPKHVVKKNPSV